MTASKKNGQNGISIRIIHAAMIICAIAIAGLLVFSTYQSSDVFSRLSKETGFYIAGQKAAHELMEASDYLTEMVQRFTLEGDRVYLDNYFEEAFVSKRRENAILSMSEGGADQVLIEQLNEAMDESLALMYREYYAMKLVIDAREIRDYPEKLKEIELKEADTDLPAEEKIALAQSMVMGSEYYSSKEIIRTRLKSDLEILDQHMNRTRQETADEMMRELSGVRIATIILAVVLVLLILLTGIFSTVPLIKAVESVRRRQPIPVIGSREFRQLARNYNEMNSSLHQEDRGQEETNT